MPAKVKAPREQPTSTKKPGRKKGEARQRLIDATIELMRKEGHAELTTGKIANGAGIQQPGFYVHFKSVDECLRAAAEQVSAQILEAEVKLRHGQLQFVQPGERIGETIHRMKLTLGMWMEDRRVAELMVRCGHDASPLGETCREASARAHKSLREDMIDLAMHFGVRGRYMQDVELMSALLVEGYNSALSFLVNHPSADVDAVATALGRAQFYHVNGEIMRMLREQASDEKKKSP